MSDYLEYSDSPVNRVKKFLTTERQDSAINSGLDIIYESREDAMYAVRLSQRKIQRAYSTVQNRDDLYFIKCKHPS